MEEFKDTYYSDLSTKLVNQKSNPKIYWSVLKTFLNNKKIPFIPSLFHENKLVTNFRILADIFNSFFAKQCPLINSDSSLPSKIIKKMDNSLYSVKFSMQIILQIINKLDSNKAHGHDVILRNNLCIFDINVNENVKKKEILYQIYLLIAYLQYQPYKYYPERVSILSVFRNL